MEDVGKRYNGSSNYGVFDKIDLKIKPGELIVAQGPIGSGKTTLLNLISGLTKPSRGRIFINDMDITNLNSDDLAVMRARTFGIVNQTLNLIPEMSIAQNLELPLVFLGLRKDERQKRVLEVLQRIGIIQMADRFASSLSVGEMEIVSIARSMVTDPPIVLMDEPTENLDSIMAEMVLSLIRGDAFLKKKTILVTTHNRKIASIASRVIHVKKTIP